MKPSAEDLFGPGYARALEFADLLDREGELRGLIGPAERARIWDRHILNSAALVELLPRDGRVADLGSGAGLPGVVLAIARPNLAFSLIEPMERRCTWLREVKELLSLDNVEVVNLRAEDVRDEFDVVTARAVAPVKRLLPMALPLVRPGGRLIALKGSSVNAELTDAKKVLAKNKVGDPKVLTVKAVPEATETTVLVVRKPPN